ncbi:CTP synthase [Candidatus Dependentiae bacterium]|nr:CTP synthase [Candidatus Dependentiae bacterium]MBU4387570.1 CTP synthase [Candidatus Dependentiae bacterium]MCG2755899.1 CTP synthase [Candidatus Dependentiae bacterium]
MEIKNLYEKVKKQNTKFIVVTGGVCSSLGKGILVSSIGVLLKNSGYSVSVIKLDPYLNVDPGTMSPLVHGEVFVTDDGAETDLDLGHYERILGSHLTKESSVSSGQIFQEVLNAERDGKYLGRDIQMIPDVVDAIKNRLINFAIKYPKDFILVEIGGTVGDIEGGVFLEAVRQLKLELEPNSVMLAHLSLVPYLEWAHEIKTKPTQHSVILLKKSGLMPDALFLRTDYKTNDKVKKKLSVMCGVKQEYIFDALTVNLIPKIFANLDTQNVNQLIQNWFGIKNIRKADLSEWENLIKLIENKKKSIKIALIAKYVGSNDPYLSVVRAIETAANFNNVGVTIEVIEAEKLENISKKEFEETFKNIDGIVVPGGFDKRGIEGKIACAKYARENNIPYFGLCLGMQIMLIEFARSVLKFKNASSTEFDKKTKYPVISMIEEQKNIDKKGGTMRLGVYTCSLIKNTRARDIYAQDAILERHRHRYEFNNKFKKEFEKNGVVFSGIYKKENLVEIAEIKNHKFMIGTQFHPEFLSTLLKPHPLFKEFIRVIVENKNK